MSTRLKVSWVLAAVVLVTALAVGAFGATGPDTQQERVYAIAAQVKCPQCAGETAAESDSSAARGVRQVIAKDLQNGMSTSEIFDDLAASYGDEIILTPTSSGVTGLVWILPVIFGVFAVAALVVVFRRWSKAGSLEASDDDRTLVEEARHQEPVVR